LKYLKNISTFESLQFRNFRWLILGSLASFLAMNMQIVTRGWLILRLTNDSPLALSLVMMAFGLPMIVVSPIGGALADRVSRKGLVMFSQGGNAILTILLATLDLTDLIQFWHLLVIGFVNGSLMAFNLPSRQSLISDIVPPDNVMNAISLNNSGMNLSRIIGPAFAGLLIIFIETAGVFYLIALLYICSVLSTSLVLENVRSSGRDKKSIFSDIGDGFAYAASNPTILCLIILLFAGSLFGWPFVALLPAWGREVLDVQSDGLGFLMMITGIGALAGSLMLASMTRPIKRGKFLIAISLGWGIGIALFSQSGTYAFVIPLLIILGLFNALFMSLNMTLLQTYVTEEMRGRIMSIILMTFGVMPLSVVPFAALAEKIGTPDALTISGIALFVFSAIFAITNHQIRKID
jgi:MFS family permease